MADDTSGSAGSDSTGEGHILSTQLIHGERVTARFVRLPYGGGSEGVQLVVGPGVR